MTAPDPIAWEQQLPIRPSSPAWAAALKAVYGAKLTASERELFLKLSGGVPPRSGGWLEVLVVAGRRSGKSESVARVATFEADVGGHAVALAPGQVGVIPVIAPKREQSAELLRFVAGLAGLPQLKRAGARVMGERVEFSRARVSVSVMSCDAITLAGGTAVGAVRDEWAKWPSEGVSPDVEVEATLRPMLVPVLGAPPRRLIGITSAFVKRGLAYETDRDHFGKRSAPVLVLRGSTPLWNPAIDEAYLKRERQRLGDVAYRREFECVWQDPSGAAFEGDLLEGAFEPGVTERPWRPGVRYSFVAFDTGLRDNSTAAGVCHREFVERPGQPPADQVVLDALHVLTPKRGLLSRAASKIGVGDKTAGRVSFDDVERLVSDLAARYRVKTVTSDLHYSDALRPRFLQRGLRHIEAPMNPAAQERRSSLLASRLSTGGLRLLDHPVLLRELREASFKVSAGKIMISAPERRSATDDALDVLLLLVELAESLKPSGSAGYEVERDLFGTGATTYYQVQRGIRLSVAPPPWAPEHVREQRKRLARGVCMQTDIDELGRETVEALMGFRTDVPIEPLPPDPTEQMREALGNLQRGHCGMSDEFAAHLDRRRRQF